MDYYSSRDWYRDYYHLVNVTARSGSLFKYVLHHSLERRYKSNLGQHLLEIGAGDGEHLQYVVDDWKLGGSYKATDIRTPTKETLERFNLAGVEFQELSGDLLPFDDKVFDRVIFTCVFHHVTSPEILIREATRVTKIGGRIDILLPNDPSMGYRIAKNLTTGIIAATKGLLREERIYHAHEHRNHFLSLIKIIKFACSDQSLKVASFPLPSFFYEINVFSVIRIHRII